MGTFGEENKKKWLLSFRCTWPWLIFWPLPGFVVFLSFFLWTSKKKKEREEFSEGKGFIFLIEMILKWLIEMTQDLLAFFEVVIPCHSLLFLACKFISLWNCYLLCYNGCSFYIMVAFNLSRHLLDSADSVHQLFFVF